MSYRHAHAHADKNRHYFLSEFPHSHFRLVSLVNSRKNSLHDQIPASNKRSAAGVTDKLASFLHCACACTHVHKCVWGAGSHALPQNAPDGSTCGRTTESPQVSVPHPCHIWCFRVSLSVTPSFKYSVYIQPTSDKTPFQIISSVCLTLLRPLECWHLRYQRYSHVPDVHGNV